MSGLLFSIYATLRLVETAHPRHLNPTTDNISIVIFFRPSTLLPPSLSHLYSTPQYWSFMFPAVFALFHHHHHCIRRRRSSVVPLPFLENYTTPLLRTFSFPVSSPSLSTVYHCFPGLSAWLTVSRACFNSTKKGIKLPFFVCLPSTCAVFDIEPNNEYISWRCRLENRSRRPFDFHIASLSCAFLIVLPHSVPIWFFVHIVFVCILPKTILDIWFRASLHGSFWEKYMLQITDFYKLIRLHILFLSFCCLRMPP